MTNDMTPIMKSKNGNFTLCQKKGISRFNSPYTGLEIITSNTVIREFIAVLEEAADFTEYLQSIIDDNGGTISADYFDDKEMEK